MHVFKIIYCIIESPSLLQLCGTHKKKDKILNKRTGAYAFYNIAIHYWPYVRNILDPAKRRIFFSHKRHFLFGRFFEYFCLLMYYFTAYLISEGVRCFNIKLFCHRSRSIVSFQNDKRWWLVNLCVLNPFFRIRMHKLLGITHQIKIKILFWFYFVLRREHSSSLLGTTDKDFPFELWWFMLFK